MSRTFLSIALNFFFLPMGYLYLGNSGRFIAATLYSFSATMLFSLIAWLLPAVLPAWTAVPVLWGLSLLVLGVIIADTYRLSKHPAPERLWPVFSKPHVFWFIPVYWIAMIALAAVTAPWERPFARTHNIPSPAMEPNVQVGDFLFADYMFDKSTLKHSDIVVHDGGKLYPGKRLIKRIVAVPGDRIQLMTADLADPGGEIFNVLRYKLNGKLVPLQYSSQGGKKYRLQDTSSAGKNSVFTETNGTNSYEILEEPFGNSAPNEYLGDNTWPEIILGPDEFFMLGDNRDHASDSRHAGPIQRSQIVGKYMYTYFSFFIPNSACELTNGVSMIWQWATAKKNTPCSGIQIRWENAGHVAH